MGWMIGAVICYVMSIVGIVTAMGDTGASGNGSNWAAGITMLALGTFFLVKFFRKRSGATDRARAKRQAVQMDRLALENIFQYIGGLDTQPETLDFSLELMGDELLLHRIKLRVPKCVIFQTFHLPLERVVNVDLVKREERVKYRAKKSRWDLPEYRILDEIREKQGVLVDFLDLIIIFMPESSNRAQTLKFDANHYGLSNRNWQYVQRIRQALADTPSTPEVREHWDRAQKRETLRREPRRDVPL